jgi:hypothetical protein
MNKIISEQQSCTLSSAPRPYPSILPSVADQRLEPTRRFIVLVPCLESDLTAVTQRVWELANATGAHVKFLGLCNDAAQEPGLRRRLVTMSAIVNYGRVSAESEVEVGSDWVDAVKSRWQAGDTVVCFAEERAGLLRGPLSQVLRSDLDVPLYILSGLYSQNDMRSKWPTQAVAWIGFIAIIFGFFMLQVKISQLEQDWTIVLELLSTAVEFWLIWVWNNLFR